MDSLILGTAGHIDHGKTALVRALTGTDTDRLKEEKERGITIELGFAELLAGDGHRFGVVDVPGHEAFVRAMVAGAAGMDVVLLVVAADESVMPQTREHLSIVRLLGVPELVVALSKCDTVEAEWLELVDAEVRELLESTPYAGAPRVATSASDGTGLDALREELSAAAERARTRGRDDLLRIPLDRVFTVQGTGTVVTGSVWSGGLSVGETVEVLPEGLEGRVRGLQAHGRETNRVEAGDRAAVALTGAAADRTVVSRGETLVSGGGWAPTWMLTTRVEMLTDTEWMLEHNQRVHLHLGTAEVLARCALLEGAALGPGERGWVQLRLEAPLIARAGDRLVIRSYSPVTTIGGGRVAEPAPPKRNRLGEQARDELARVLDGGVDDAVEACLALAGWQGVSHARLPVLTGHTPSRAGEALDRLRGAGALVTADRCFSVGIREEAEGRVLDAVEEGHTADSLRPSVPLARVRSAVPDWASADLSDAVLDELVRVGRLEAFDGGVRRPGFEPALTSDQERASTALVDALLGPGLAAPLVDDLPSALTGRDDFWSLVRHLETNDTVRQVADGLYVGSDALDRAAAEVTDRLGGRTGLGPADFREVLDVTRRHLIPLLNYFDGRGTTLRRENGRDVPKSE